MTQQSSSRITPQQAQEIIDSRVTPLTAESRPLEQCVGRILRQDVYAERDNPPFDRVCMDGVAIDSAAVARGLRRFTIESMQAAGSPAVALSRPENAVEVMTGAILPYGTDCIIPMEEYQLTGNVVSLKNSVLAAPYRNVQRQGADSDRGVPMLRAGTLLGAPEMAVLASAGLATVQVSRQPKVMVISTGDELIEPGHPIEAHQVRRSNAYAVLAAIRRRGYESVHNDHISDDEATLRHRLEQHLAERDVLVLSGGVSQGKFDLVPAALKGVGVEEVFYQIAQRPGMPMWFGIGPGGQAVFGLPGNPVATLVCLIRYVIPALSAAMEARRPAKELIALATSVTNRPMTYFLPVSVQYNDLGHAVALPRPPNGPGDFLALTEADGFVELPPQAQPHPAGFVATLYRW